MIPEDAIKIQTPNNELILAEGEVTGHAHRLKGDVEGFLSGETMYIKVNDYAHVSHEEHHTRTVPPGLMKRHIQKEWDYVGEIERTVLD